MPRFTPINAQTTRVWGNLRNAATYLIQAIVYKFEIDSHDYRTKSEPMLSFILGDLHDGITKTKYRYYRAPTNAKFVSNMA